MTFPAGRMERGLVVLLCGLRYLVDCLTLRVSISLFRSLAGFGAVLCRIVPYRVAWL